METLQRAFDRIEWGTTREKSQLYTLGKILACPKLGTECFEYFEAIAKGKKPKEPGRINNHWEIKASELVSALVCMMVFQNNNHIRFKKPFLFDFYHFMVKNHLYLYGKLAYDEARINRFCERLKKLSNKPVSERYAITTNTNKWIVTKDMLDEIYPKVKKKHPYIKNIVEDFLSCGKYEKQDILLEMFKGLECHFEKLRTE